MKICFWGNVAGALNGNPIGGGELQIALLAKVLAKIGHEVVVLDYETTEKFETCEGIKVYPIKGWNKGLRIIRAFTHRLPQLYLSLRDQKADIYYCRILDSRHIFAYLAAQKVKANFILGLASDFEVMNFRARWKYYYLDNLHNPWFFFDGIFSEIVYPWLLRKSNYVFVQHIGQREILLRKNINSVVFPNLVDLNDLPVVTNPVKKDFVYIGWLEKRKGFVEFFELIKKAKLHTFKVIGQPVGKTGFIYYQKLKLFKNVTLFGKLNHSETLSNILNSKALISTSPMEGFPNVFIEAWACGIPVLSLHVDPGNVITKEGLGMVANGDTDKLLHAMGTIENTKLFEKKAKAYVESNHVLNSTKIKEISCLFSELFNHS
jgi:glycosyltransferase involved in cell wall biosynthesis